jgi:hypothetical protein
MKKNRRPKISGHCPNKLIIKRITSGVGPEIVQYSILEKYFISDYVFLLKDEVPINCNILDNMTENISGKFLRKDKQEYLIFFHQVFVKKLEFHLLYCDILYFVAVGHTAL